MKKVRIRRNTNGDTRTATKVPTISEFVTANASHASEVQKMMEYFAEELLNRGKHHDWSKLTEPHKSSFYIDLCETLKGHIRFEDGDWAKFHYENERHHLLRRVPEDVNLVDVIEMLADCVCAGLARSGSVRDLEISTDILEKAVENTVIMMKNAAVVEE